jgi:hypothetical protein
VRTSEQFSEQLGREKVVSTRTLVLGAAATNLAVMATTYVVRGWNVVGAHAAARNTARFSALWFALAFAGPGLVRFFRGLPAPESLVRSFFAAHAVHFGAVAILLTRFEISHVSQNPGRAAAVVSGGFLLVLVTALTATPTRSWTYSYLHRATLYAVFLIFFLAFAVNPVKPVRAAAVLLALSLILRLSSGLKFHSAAVKSAS